MRVFVAGGTGALGRPLVAALLAAGHEVTVLTRRAERAAALRGAGVEPVVADAFDAEAVRAAIVAARPEVVVDQLTALPERLDPRRYAAAAATAPTACGARRTAPSLAAARGGGRPAPDRRRRRVHATRRRAAG